jgi:protein gp37
LPKDFFPRNVWWGISAENQETLDKRWSELDLAFYNQDPAVMFVSAEPLISPLEDIIVASNLEIHRWTRIPQWVIVGGESGPGCRPMNLEWARDIHRQCQEHEIPFFMKQDSGPKPGTKGRIPDDLWIQEFPVVNS